MIQFEDLTKTTERLLKKARDLPGGARRQAGLVAADLYGKIVSRTPYNKKGLKQYEFSGNAQQSWYIDVAAGGGDDLLNIEVFGGGTKTERTGSSPISYNAARSEARSAIGDLYHLEGARIQFVSDIEYMADLEDGYSGQAPDGFIRLALHDAVDELKAKIERSSD